MKIAPDKLEHIMGGAVASFSGMFAYLLCMAELDDPSTIVNIALAGLIVSHVVGWLKELRDLITKKGTFEIMDILATTTGGLSSSIYVLIAAAIAHAVLGSVS